MTQRMGRWMAVTTRRFAADETGSTAIEYAFLAFVAVALIAVMSMFSESIVGFYERVRTVVEG